MKFLSLFSGIGGFDLGLERAGMQCVGQVEINPFCQRVLAHHWPHVKRMGDIKDVKGTEFGAVDLVCGGVPCQPASNAGKRRGTKDDRWLWPEAFRIVRAVKPRWCVFENVRGILTLEQGVVFEALLFELEGIGYKVEAFIIPACAVDAPHRRDRVWILAHSKHDGWHGSEITKCVGARIRVQTGTGGTEQPERSSSGEGGVEVVADTHSSGFGEQRGAEPVQPELDTAECAGEDATNAESSRRKTWESDSIRNAKSKGRFTCVCRWLPEPGVGRVAHGIPGRVDRLRSLGNAVVPQIVEEIGRAIMQAECLDNQLTKE